MTLSPIPEKTQALNVRRMEFASLAQGANLVRVLDDDYLAVETHFINRSSVACSGESCPVCLNNRTLIRENPDTFRDVKGYYPKSTRFFINVFDRTPVKVCPNCKTDIKQTNLPACPECNAVIMQEPITPLNKVKVLSKGKTLFEQLVQLENAITDEDGTRIGLKNFDITLMVAGAGKTQTTSPIFTGKRGAPVEVPADQLYDLERAVVRLTPSEIKDLQMGVSLGDIYKARKLEADTKVPQVVEPKNLEEAVQSAMNLFE